MRFIEQANQLTIVLEGFEQLWALKRRIQIPHFAIQEVDFIAQQPVMKDFEGRWRMPGTALPGHFRAGSYRHNGERQFWFLRMHQAGVLTITLKPDILNYAKVRVSCTLRLPKALPIGGRNTRTSHGLQGRFSYALNRIARRGSNH
jgi:hypothetical protein